VRTVLRCLLALGTVTAAGLTALCEDPVSLVLERVERANETYPSGSVYLVDSGRVSVSADGRHTLRAHVQILLRGVTAIASYGEVSIDYFESMHDVTVVYARTILPTGEVIELTDADMHVTQPSSKALGVGETCATTLTLSMPSLASGAVIDYEYVRADKPNAFMDGFDVLWTFEHWDPVQLSEFVLDVPRGIDCHWTAHGRTIAPDIQSDSSRTVYTFRAVDVPGVTEEVRMPSLRAVSSYVVASSFASWEEVATAWWTWIERKLDTGPEIAAKARELIAGTPSEAAIVSRLFDFVAGEIRYDLIATGAFSFEPRPALDTLATRSGDCKDQSVLLLSLLRCAGVDAYPVLANTDTGYHVDWSATPSTTQFDHVIVGVPDPGGGWRLLDPTCAACTSNYALSGLRGRRWLLASPNPAEFGVHVETPPPSASESLTRCTMTGSLSEGGDLNGEALVQMTGDTDVVYRTILLAVEETDCTLDEVFPALLYGTPYYEVLDYKLSDLADTHEPLGYRLSFRASEFTDDIVGREYLHFFAYGPTFTCVPCLEKTTPRVKREHPLLTDVSQYELRALVDLGDRAVAELPEDVHVENAVGAFRATYSLTGSTLVYTRILRIDVSEVTPNEYLLYAEIVRAAVLARIVRIPLRFSP